MSIEKLLATNLPHPNAAHPPLIALPFWFPETRPPAQIFPSGRHVFRTDVHPQLPLGILIRYSGRHNDPFPGLPVRRGIHLVLPIHLERIDGPQHLAEVAPDRARVEKRQADLR